MHALSDLPLAGAKEVTWDVTQEDIDLGERLDCWRCPVALSLERAFPDLMPEVDPVEIVLYTKTEDGDRGSRYAKAATPDMAYTFIEAFDGDNHVEPVSLTVTFVWA